MTKRNHLGQSEVIAQGPVGLEKIPPALRAIGEGVPKRAPTTRDRYLGDPLPVIQV